MKSGYFANEGRDTAQRCPSLDVRAGRALCLAQDSRDLGAAHRADALCETTPIGLFDVSGELALFLALHAVRLAGVALSHRALLISRVRALELKTAAGWLAPP